MGFLSEEKVIEIVRKIKKGELGKSGDRFYTVRELAQKEDVSLVTAQQIMSELKSRGFVEYYKKNNYIVYGRVDRNSPLKTAKPTAEKLIGIHISNIKSPFFSRLVREIEEKAAEAGYRCITATSAYNMEEEKEILSMFCRLNVGGVISTPGTGTDFQTKELYKRYTLPFVFIGYRFFEELGADSVMVDNFAAGEQVANHFINEGYRNFVYIGLGELENFEDPRLAGFRSGLEKSGMSVKDENIIRVSANEPERFKTRLRNIVLDNQQPIAVFCYHDLIAIEVLKFCEQQGMEVPEQVAIAGFDNLDITKQVSPQLTTVKYNITKMAETAVKMLTQKIETGKTEYGKYYVPPILAVRGSSGKEYEKSGSANIETII